MYKEFQLKLLENEMNAKKQAVLHWDKAVLVVRTDLRSTVILLDYFNTSKTQLLTTVPLYLILLPTIQSSLKIAKFHLLILSTF